MSRVKFNSLINSASKKKQRMLREIFFLNYSIRLLINFFKLIYIKFEFKGKKTTIFFDTKYFANSFLMRHLKASTLYAIVINISLDVLLVFIQVLEDLSLDATSCIVIVCCGGTLGYFI